MPGTLFIVATPIGNLEDITARALRVLREVDVIACEDTRHTKRLLHHFGIQTRTVSYHEHNERQRAEEMCALIESGKNVAVVSDAGTPLISDPGFRVVTAAIERNLPIVPIPGAAAFVTALAASGLSSDQFVFVGFLPARAGARRVKLDELRSIPATLVFYEAPHRIAATLRDAFEVLGNRPAVVARELTKLHEEIVRGNLNELAARFSGPEKARGEIVLLIGSSPSETLQTEAGSPDDLARRIEVMKSDGIDPRDALKIAARELGIKRADAYRMMVNQKNRRSK